MTTDKQELQRLCDPTDDELIQFAVEEQFLLFCDEDDFVQIAREVLYKWGRKHAAELAAVTTERDGMAGHVRVPVELLEFIEAKEHHLPVQDQHVLSVMLNAIKGEL